MAKKKEEIEEGKISCVMDTIESCIDFVQSIVNKRGNSKPLTRKEIAISIGRHESYIIYKLSSSVQYGLLNKFFGQGYQPSELFDKIVNPVFKNHSIAAKYQAMKNPKLYDILIEQFNGKILPDEDGFVNLLKGKDFKFIQNTAERGVKTFLANARDLKIIDDNRRLTFIIPDDEVESIKPPAIITPEITKPEHQNGSENKTSLGIPPDNGTFTLYIQLTGEDRIATLTYPKKIEKQDIEVIRAYLIGVEARLKSINSNKREEDVPTI